MIDSSNLSNNHLKHSQLQAILIDAGLARLVYQTILY